MGVEVWDLDRVLIKAFKKRLKVVKKIFLQEKMNLYVCLTF